MVSRDRVAIRTSMTEVTEVTDYELPTLAI